MMVWKIHCPFPRGPVFSGSSRLIFLFRGVECHFKAWSTFEYLAVATESAIKKSTPLTHAFAALKQNPSCRVPKLAAELGRLSMADPVSWVVMFGMKKLFFQGVKDTKSWFECQRINAVQNCNKLSDFLQQHYDTNKTGCLSAEEIETWCHIQLCFIREFWAQKIRFVVVHWSVSQERGIKEVGGKLKSNENPEEREMLTYILSLLLYAKTVLIALNKDSRGKPLQGQFFV